MSKQNKNVLSIYIINCIIIGIIFYFKNENINQLLFVPIIAIFTSIITIPLITLYILWFTDNFKIEVEDIIYNDSIYDNDKKKIIAIKRLLLKK